MARATRLTLWAERQFVRRSLRHRPDRGRLVELEPALAAKRDALAPIHHIVVLMMENHSYDNYLGMHEKGDGFTRGPDGLPTATNPDREGNPVPARRRPDSSQEHGLPTQSWRASYEQWNEGACDGFVVTAEDLARELGRTGDPKVAMSYWEEDDLPFYYCLARTFPVVDRWFGSCLGPTFPNRRFLVAGTAHGLIDDLPFGMLDYPKAGTIFDLLTANGIFWVNYHNVSPLLIALRRILGKPGLKVGRALGLLASQLIKPLMRWAFSRKEFTADLYPLGALGVGNHVRSLDRFFEDTANGTLPPFSIVDPDFRCFSEENPQDVRVGESFAAAVIKAVMAGKGWRDTMLIWTYDEHGGYFDHVPPPAAEPPDDVPGQSILSWLGAFSWLFRRFGWWNKLQLADRLEHHAYDRYGFRVPAVIVSPYAKRDWVCPPDRVYDHTSILKMIELKWSLPPLTRRDALAQDFLDALDLETPAPPFATPPPLAEPAVRWKGVREAARACE